jgi:choline kinase
MFKAVYLVAGVGQRLRPLTDRTPKALLPVNGKPLLAWSIEAAKACGITDFVVVTGYREDHFLRFFRERFPDVRVQFIRNDDYASTNNSYSLWHAGRAFSGEGMVLMDGDILFEKRLLESLMTSPSDHNYVTVRRSDDLGTEEMKVMVDRDGRIVALAKTLDPLACYGESIGIEKFTPDFTHKLFDVLDRRMNREGRRGEYYEASFQELIDAGESVRMLDTFPHRCMEIDTPEDLETANRIMVPFLDTPGAGV